MPKARGHNADPNNSSAPGKRPNTIGHAEKELFALLDKLDDESSEGSVKRTYARWPLRHTSLELILEHPGGSTATFRVACRNLSRGGMAVLHNAFAHTGTACKIMIPRLDNAIETVPGDIMRCTHIQGIAHELGIAFKEHLQLGDFIELDPMMGWSSYESVDPDTLAGSLLVVTENDLDERIIRHFLGETQLKIRFAKTSEEVLDDRSSRADVAMVDLSIEDAPDLVQSIRNEGKASAVIAIGPDATPNTRRILEQVKADGFVFKPLSNDRLLGALAECILSGEALQVDAALAGESSGALLKSCIEQLQTCASDLRAAISDSDPMRCYAICQHIKAISIPIGVRPITKLAEQVSVNVAQSMSVEESLSKLQDLVRLCERIRAGNGAAA